ncbi:MAG: Asp-tRNA(Asn)/Glu-tRNA(Gln) amidotransferase subunit GatB [Myxococcales bacterium FL481]|nr:MAG: Asp-tRNA(Asn)/Glu-tRNA(Gln) amidotransferase subunit GatB [Myxococcales bacterium FL481]
MTRYEPIIGLEVHCQLNTRSKLFSPCSFAFGDPPNTHTDPYVWAMPGTLPVLNGHAVSLAIRLALATHSRIEPISRFARKHYFYPDLPKGYQISQADQPYCTGGYVDLPETADQPSKRVRLIRIHLEEDAGKNTHVTGRDFSLVDYNRAGVPLCEIVSEPDLRSAAEAVAYLRELRTIVRYLGICEANMEEGSLRCDANVSLRRHGATELGTRCEIKNLNSFKFLEAAIEAEVRRQTDLVERGEPIRQCTLSFDPQRDRTRVMRSKEEAADYRYLPDPDLPPLQIDQAWIADEQAHLPELPGARRARYAGLGLSSYDVSVLTNEPALAEFFDATIELGSEPKSACNWITVELLGRLNADSKTPAQSPVSPRDMHDLLDLLKRGTISGRVGKDVFQKMYLEGRRAQEIVEQDGLGQISDANVLRDLVAAVLADHPDQVAEFRQGKTKVRGFFVGQIMRRSRGQANPSVVNTVLDELLASP